MQNICVGIDIGSSKISATLSNDNDNSFEIIQSVCVNSKGVSKGKIINLTEAAQSIKDCVELLKQSTDMSFNEVYVGVNSLGCRLISNTGISYVNSMNNTIDMDNIREAVEDSKNIKLPDDEEIVDVIIESFVVDEKSKIDNPIGLKGKRLEVISNIVVGKRELLDDLKGVVGLAGLKINGFSLSINAARKIFLNDKTELSSILIVDVGADTTQLAYFKNNTLKYFSFLPIGGENITRDISVCTSVSRHEAEKTKKLHSINYFTKYREEAVASFKSSTLEFDIKLYKNIVKARLEEIATLIHENIENSKYLDEIDGVYVIGDGVTYFEDIRYIIEDKLRKKTVIVTKNQLGLQNSCIITSIGIVKNAYDRLKLICEKNSKDNLKEQSLRNNMKSSMKSDIKSSMKSSMKSSTRNSMKKEPRKRRGFIHNLKRIIDDIF